ncbi:hypothetical protein PIB30_103404, partial [Stylosanthes scabra]|nr:hypothetical protein [Stylosanthes scabra]
MLQQKNKSSEAIARTPEDLKKVEIGVRSGAQDTDQVPSKSKDDITTSGSDEAIAQSRGRIFDD